MADIRTFITRELSGRRRDISLRFCGSSVRADADKIGWMPWDFYDRLDRQGGLVVVRRDDELVGFAAFDVCKSTLQARVFQAWVQRDARRREHGLALVARVQRVVGPRPVRAWVAADLDAVQFWASIGFAERGRRLGKGSALLAQARVREHILFHREVHFGRGFQADSSDPVVLPAGGPGARSVAGRDHVAGARAALEGGRQAACLGLPFGA